MKRIFFIILIILISIRYSDAIDIRVGIINGKEPVNFGATGYMDLIDLSTNEIILTTYGLGNGSIRANQNGLEVKDVGTFRGTFLLKPIVGAKALVNGNKYRGEIEVEINGDEIKVINVIDLEEYLYGVIKNEMSSNAPMEALKAQAVIARTFALANLKKHEEEGYNLCSKVHCQVYKGMDTETDSVINAVNSTQAQVLTYNGEIAKIFYHAWCGGITADASSVWGQDISYLKEVPDPFCRKLGNNGWQYTFALNEIKDILNKNGFNIGNISSIYEGSKSKSERVNEVVIIHTNGTTAISSNKFRLMVGPDKIWSTLFTIRRNGNKVTFQGRGKGHGVGLCQQGAIMMGKLGYNYKQILGFYYPGIYLRSVIFEEE
ncbi:MAG: SpoIID/LytB domain-containing protein [bacterium]